MRTRTRGIAVDEGGNRSIDKQYKGWRIFTRLGAVSQDAAEAWLRQEQQRIDFASAKDLDVTFCDAAARYIKECERKGVRTIDMTCYHIDLIAPYIGTKPLEAIHSGTLARFCDDRLAGDKDAGKAPVSATTINRTLEVVRTILIRAARVWRDDNGKPLLASAPLIEMLSEDRRKPYPITWHEQQRLFAELPAHIEKMAMFAVNTGLRDENVCGLKWSWEKYIPELKRSVFVIPAGEFKSNRNHVAILNDAAYRVMESCRGIHPEYVFTYQRKLKDHLKELPPDRVETINSNGWQKARKRAGLTQVRVHDLRHTFGHRLRDAGVTEEDRAALMGHATTSMAGHYATPTLERLVAMANLVQTTRDTPTLLRVANG